MQKHECVILVIEVQYPVIAGAQFPDIIIQMFGDILGEACAVVLQELDMQCYLLVLNARIFVRRGFLA